MSRRVLVIGVDAAEATLIDRWAEAGSLGHFRDLARLGASYKLSNSMTTLPGAIWPEIVTGRSAGTLGQYYHPRQLHTGEAVARKIEAHEVDPQQFYWAHASRAGKRCVVIDQVQTVGVPGFNGVQLFEWGLHDRHFAMTSDPPSLLQEIRARHGDHPVHQCDTHGASLEGYDELLRGLLHGITQKTRFTLELLAKEQWDLFAVTFSEAHCGGHQFWHLHDPADRRHDHKAPIHLKNALQSVYRAIDDAIGALLRACGSEAVVLVVASHGMGPNLGGPQLLPEVLIRLGLGPGRASAATPAQNGFTWHKALARGMYTRLRTRVRLPGGRRPLIGSRLGRSVRNYFECPVDLDHAAVKAASLLNDRCGAIRLNLIGREPRGCIRPGEQADRLVASLREQLLALTDDVGRPIVGHVKTAEEAFGRGHHPDLPDLIIDFRTDIGPVERCQSPTVGPIERLLWKPEAPRTGDHTVESRLWIVGDGLGPASGGIRNASVLDIAPTVLHLLGVPAPDELDGSVVPDARILPS